jgi:hypothetical protein
MTQLSAKRNASSIAGSKSSRPQFIHSFFLSQELRFDSQPSETRNAFLLLDSKTKEVNTHRRPLARVLQMRSSSHKSHDSTQLSAQASLAIRPICNQLIQLGLQIHYCRPAGHAKANC